MEVGNTRLYLALIAFRFIDICNMKSAYIFMRSLLSLSIYSNKQLFTSAVSQRVRGRGGVGEDRDLYALCVVPKTFTFLELKLAQVFVFE